MAGVLVDPGVAGRPDVLSAPWRGPDVGILDRELVEQRVGVDPGEAFHDMKIASRAPEGRRVVEVGGVAHERVALPVADRVAQPAPDLGWRMLLIHPDDARIVHHLDQDHHIVVGLNDPLQIVVQDRQHRRPAG